MDTEYIRNVHMGTRVCVFVIIDFPNKKKLLFQRIGRPSSPQNNLTTAHMMQ